MLAISIRDVTMQFDSFTALDNVSLNVSEGEFVTLLGPSGCGKTTLLKIVSGFLKPTAGRVEIAGRDVTGMPPENRDTAMCFQSYALFPHLSVTENIVFGLKQKRLAADERERRLDDVVRQVDLGAHLDKLPNQLSGGQQQRVALARALAMRPYLILFDEPLSNLDAKLRETVRYEIRKITREYGLTAVYVTHDQTEALAMSDRIFIMNAGRIEQVGAPEDIYHHPRTSFVADFIGSANLLDGEIVEEPADGTVSVRTAMGPVRVALNGSKPGKNVRLCWRPERARPGHRDGANNFDVRIDHRSFQGHFTDLMFEADGTPQRLQLVDADVREGDRFGFSLDLDDIVILEDRP